MKYKTKIFLNQNQKRLKKKKKKIELEESLFKLKKYCDYNDAKYKGIRDMKNLFNQSVVKDYYKPIKTTNGVTNKNNYIEYESKWDKDNDLLLKEYLDMIKPYLSDIIKWT